MSLKSLVRQKFISDIIQGAVSPEDEYRKKTPGIVNWRVLVVDSKAMPIVSSCCSMHEICNEGITIVEDLHKRREPLPSFDTIYVLAPTKESVRAVIKDFEDEWHPMYKKIYLYFLQACPDDLFMAISKSNCGGRIEKIVEVNMAFLPVEQQVFTMHSRESFRQFYKDPSNSDGVDSSVQIALENVAEQIATLCSTIGEFPTVRYRAAFERNLELATLVLKKLELYKTTEDGRRMAMKEGAGHCELIILDRGFDPITPILHELTYQAMVYDLLDIDKDVYSFVSNENGRQEDVILNEKDDLWVELRHQHIADVTSCLPKKIKQLQMTQKAKPTGMPTTTDLRELIQKTPQYQRDLKKCDIHSRLAGDCMKVYGRGIDRLCQVEQDLAMGTTSDGSKVTDKMLMQKINPIVLNEQDSKGQIISEADKIRVILLYIQRKKDILAETELNRLLQHANISPAGRRIVYNAAQIGFKVAQKDNKKKTIPTVERTRKRNTDGGFDLSRWTPIVKDIIEDSIENKLSEKLFPPINGRSISNGKRAAPVSARFVQGPRDGKIEHQSIIRDIPKLIIFIVGGVSYSEMRVAYEVTKGNRNWDVLIGSTHLTVPEQFLDDLSSLSNSF